MYISIKKSNNIDEKSSEPWFPLKEGKLSEICKEIGIGLSKGVNCYIVDSNDRDFISVIKEHYCNVDELNFLTKRLDSFDVREKTTFYASAIATDAKTIGDLINLTYNTHCYSVISDFSNLDAVGKTVYLNEVGAATSKEMELIDGRTVVEDLMKFSPMKVVTPYGVIYQNRNEPELVYDGKHFPCYYWQSEIVTLVLEVGGDREFVYLPSAESAIQKALMRLDVESLSECNATIESDSFPIRMIELIEKEDSITSKIELLNEFAKQFKEMGNHDEAYFEKLMDYVGPRNLEEVSALLENMYEFEMFDGIRNAEEYGRYMICDSGHFEYDENLEDYIDFNGYGQQKIKNECGAFTKQGYITCHSNKQALENLLFENLGMVLEREKQTFQMKLYMPLKVITYDVENDYGYMEKSDHEEELSPHELIGYEEEILKAIEKSKLPGEEKRGMMKYYGTCDSVNAKVPKYEFTVEEVNGELMGVAVITLNEVLSEKELELIKNEITGQASDGFGEGFEQREIQTDDKSIYVSFWNCSDWSLKTAEALGLIEQAQSMGGMSI